MANLCRKVGINVFTFMQKAGLTPEQFSEKTSYSINDIWRVIEGKVMLPPVELQKIASVLGTTKEELISNEPDRLIPNLEFMKEFSNPCSRIVLQIYVPDIALCNFRSV